MHLIDFVVRARKEFIRSKYDAEIRVSVDIDAEKEIKKTEKELNDLTKRLNRLREKSNEIELFDKSKNKADKLALLGYQAEGLEKRIGDLTVKNEQLKASLASGTEAKGFDKMATSAKKCFGIIKNGSKESTKGMNATRKALGNVVLSMIAFQALMKGTEFIAAGFKNLVQYSDELNAAFSDMKSQTATLKNSLTTAFAPVVELMIPYLTKLISWLNTAMNTLAQFWAYLSGKGTYTRAKKQVVDYAKSLEDASKSAKGALASFDEINVLNKDEGGAGGEVTGGAAFEEAAVDQSKFEWVDWLRENLKTVLEIVGAIGIGFLAWKITGLVASLMGITPALSTLWGVALLVGGAIAYIVGISDALVNGIDWGNFTVIMLGAVAAISGAFLLFGPAATGVVALCAGFGMLVVGIKDAIDNGINLKNGLMIVAGVFLGLAGTIGFGVATIGALVAGLILAIIRDWDNFKQTVIEPLKIWLNTLLEDFMQVVNGIKNVFSGLIKFIKGVFTLDWKLAWEGVCQVFEGIWDVISGVVKFAINGIIGFINLLINATVGTVNAIVSAINSLSFTAPDWVPFIGGQKVSFNLPTVTAQNIPYLATGGTVTASTLAHLSENGRKEVVLPLEQNTEWADILSDKIGAGRPVVIRFEGDLAELGRILKPVIDTENTRVGNNLAFN